MFVVFSWDTSMNRIGEGFLVLVLGLSLMAAEVQGQDRPATPAEQYKALLKESQDRYHASHQEYVASAPKGACSRKAARCSARR